MSLKSTLHLDLKAKPSESTETLLSVTTRPDDEDYKCQCYQPRCICVPRYNSIGTLTYFGPPIENLLGYSKVGDNGPITVDEDVLCSAINRAISKNPKDFISMLDTRSVGNKQVRHIMMEIKLAGYFLQESPFDS